MRYAGYICTTAGEAGVDAELELFGPLDTERLSGSGTPVGAVTPDYEGQEYLDTSGPIWYKSTGLTDTDWVALN